MKTEDIAKQALTGALKGDFKLAEALDKNDEFWTRQEARIKEVEDEQRRARLHRFEMAQRQREKLLPEQYREEFKPELCGIDPKTVRIAFKWTPEASKGIGLCGGSGIGKTRLLAAVLMQQECSWLFCPATRLANAVRKQYDDDFGVASRAARYIEEAHNVRVLLLDDLGMESPTAAVTAEIIDLIEYRMSRNLKILWTSNRTSAQLSAHYKESGQAIARRLAESSWMP